MGVAQRLGNCEPGCDRWLMEVNVAVEVTETLDGGLRPDGLLFEPVAVAMPKPKAPRWRVAGRVVAVMLRPLEESSKDNPLPLFPLMLLPKTSLSALFLTLEPQSLAWTEEKLALPVFGHEAAKLAGAGELRPGT